MALFIWADPTDLPNCSVLRDTDMGSQSLVELLLQSECLFQRSMRGLLPSFGPRLLLLHNKLSTEILSKPYGTRASAMIGSPHRLIRMLPSFDPLLPLRHTRLSMGQGRAQRLEAPSNRGRVSKQGRTNLSKQGRTVWRTNLRVSNSKMLRQSIGPSSGSALFLLKRALMYALRGSFLVERRTGAIKAMRDVEIEHLLTGLRLLRSNFNTEQLKTPVLQFFEGNLPNLSFVRNGKDGQFEVQWKDKDGNFSTSHGDIHNSLLHHMSMAFPECSASAMPSFPGGFEFSSKMGDLVMEEHSDTHILGQDGLQTPGVSSQRLSVGATPKTARLPKRGEMLLSVHGSPLGVYKDDNMESIRESEEG